MAMPQIEIQFVNNEGGGFAERLQVPANYTVGQLFANKMGASTQPSRYLIRVNRAPAASDQVLSNGDRVSFTPTKIEGAAA